VPIEEARAAKTLGASLAAAVALPLAPDEAELLSPAEWEEIAIVSSVRPVAGSADDMATVTPAPGTKCVRCWRVLSEVGSVAAHPSLCLRCADAVESGLVCRAAA